MEEKLGICPICGEEVKKVEGYNFYACKNRDCDFKIGEKICNSEITEDDVKNILNKKTTDIKTFKWKSGSEGKARLKWSDDEKKIVFIFENDKNNQKAICKCPLCGEDIHFIKNKFYVCSSGKEKCGFIISKDLFGITLTEKEVINLCNGEKTEVKDMTFKNGSTGRGQLSYNKQEKKIEIIFE